MERVQEALTRGHISSGGWFSEKASLRLQTFHEAAEVLLTTSCTDALEMSAMLAGIQPGDVVIVPSFTFSSTATAFARQGARIRFCDIRRPELGLDPDDVRRCISEEVRAIVTVHYAGVPSAVIELREIADEYGIPLIEDNAHGLFGSFSGRPLGTFGRMSTLSFHETKNFSCGEGGALVLNDSEDIEQAHILLDKGTNRQSFLDGVVDKYTWQGHGSSFGLSDLLAAFLDVQLENRDEIQARRRRVSLNYRNRLQPLSTEFGFSLPYEPPDAVPTDHMFYILLPRPDLRAPLMARMREDGINTAFHYVPLHSAPAAAILADSYRDCPVSDDVSSRILRLPFFNDLTEQDLERVAASLENALRETV